MPKIKYNKIKGSKSDDTISGTGGPDDINARQGDDMVFAGAGDDKIKGGSGSDELHGEAGNDYIDGQSGADSLFGGDGDDILDGGSGSGSGKASAADFSDYLDGGAGDDLLIGRDGSDILLGGAGDDILYGDDGGSGKGSGSGGSGKGSGSGGSGKGSDNRRSGKGSGSGGSGKGSGSGSGDIEFGDYLDGGSGNDVLYAQEGDDTANYNVSENIGSSDVYDGGSGADTLRLEFTRDEWMRDDVQQDIADYLQFLADNTSSRSGQANKTAFQFQSFDLTASRFESLRVTVDGEELDPADEAVTANDSGNTTSGEHEPVSGNVLDNDDVPDLVRSVEIIAPPAKGTASIDDEGNYSFDPGNDFDDLAQGETEQVSFTYKVTDADRDEGTATVTIVVTGTNDVPIANVDSGISEENSSIVVDVLANDTDVDTSDTHTVDQVVIANGLGAVAIVANQIEWSPGTDYDYLALGESAQVEIDYTMSDNNGAESSSTLTLTVTGSNDGPVANVDADETEENSAIVVDVLANDSDVDASDSHTVDRATVSTGLGAVAIVANQIEWNPGSDYDYLAVGESAQVVIDYTMSDNHGAESSSTLTLTVTGSNDGPVAVADFDSAGENSSLVIDALQNDTDVDVSDTHTITAASISSGLGEVSIQGNALFWTPAAPPASSSAAAALSTAGPVIAPSVYDYLAAGETAEVLIDYTIDDGNGGESSSTATITVEGLNDAPVVAPALMQTVNEQDPLFQVDLLAGASDVDDSDVLSAVAVQEANGKGGWSVNGNTLTIDPDYFDDLNTGDTETLSLSYQVQDGNGGSVNQTLDYTIDGHTDAPKLNVTLDSGSFGVNQIGLVIDTEPADDERVALTFADIPAGARVMFNGQDVSLSGIADAAASLAVVLELPGDADVKTDLEVIATGYDSDDNQVGDTAVDTVDVSFDHSNVTEVVSFSAEDQGMWDAGPAPMIGWHEYFPIVGGETDAWTSGTFNVVDIGLDLDEIAGGMLNFFQGPLDDAQDWQASAQADVSAAQAAHTSAYNKAVHVDGVVGAWNDYNVKNALYLTAYGLWRAAQDLADNAGNNADADAANLASAEAHLSNLQDQRHDLEVAARITWRTWVPTPKWDDLFDGYWQTHHGHDPIKYAAVIAKDTEIAAQHAYIGLIKLDAAGTEATEAVLQAAADELKPAKDTAEANKNAAYDLATNLEDAMHTAGFYVGQNVDSGTVIAAWADVPIKFADIAVQQTELGLATVAVEAAQLAMDGAQAVMDTVDFNADFSLDIGLHAKVGLQVDFTLDTGSVDASVEYDLSTQAQHNLTTDTLAITPMAVNKVTGDSVAFSTISPNVTFYAGILYDIGADVDMFVDAAFAVAGSSIFDISGSHDGIRIQESIGMDGVITLIDFDSTDVGTLKVPFLESATEGIISATLNVPNIQTEGTAAPFSDSYYKEGGLLNVDFSEISTAFFNFINAGIDFSPEIRAAFASLGDISEGSAGFDAIMASVGDVLTGIWEVLDGSADTDGDGVVPIFLLDATDETATSLLHLNLVPDDLTGIDVNSGSMGFYVSYGESAPIVQVSIDLDEFVALVANLAVGNGSGEIINPLVEQKGLDLILDLADVPTATADQIKNYVNASYTFEYADVDVSSGWKFKQEFTLSIDDMLYSVEMEDGTTFEFAANDPDASLEIQDVSQYDANGDGQAEYSLSLVPEAMFSNDTELGMSIGYTLDFLKAKLATGLSIPLGDIFGVPALPALPIPMLNLNLGPLLRVKGDLDILDVDIYENRFAFDLGSDNSSGAFSLVDDVIVGTAGDDILQGNEGDDQLTGAGGNDIFIFADGHGNDVITDFSAGAGSDDVIDLLAVAGINSFEDVQFAAADDPYGNAVIDLGAGNGIMLVGVATTELHSDDFLV